MVVGNEVARQRATDEDAGLTLLRTCYRRVQIASRRRHVLDPLLGIRFGVNAYCGYGHFAPIHVCNIAVPPHPL